MVVPPVLLCLALGLWGIRRDGSMWRDEAVSYDMARRPLPDLVATLAHMDAVHGLYYMLLHGLFQISGDLDPLLVLRLPSVLAAAAATALVALLGHRLAGARAGLLTGLAFALLPPVQRYAQEGRSYALVCALVAWASYLLLGAVGSGRRRAWAGYWAVLLTACLLHEFAVLAGLAHLVALPRHARRAAAATLCAVGAALSPLVVLSTTQSAQVDWIGGPGAGELLSFAGVAALGIGCAALTKGPLARLALPLVLLPTLTLLLLSPLKPLYVDRYVLYGYLGTALLIGAALDRLLRTRAVPVLIATGVAVVALLPASLDLRTPGSRTDDVTAVARALREADADAVVFMPSRRRIWTPTASPGLRDLALDRSPAASRTLYGTEVPAREIRARLLAETRVVSLRDPEGQPLDRTPQEIAKRQVLDTYFVECGTRAVQGARITVHARPGAC